MWQFSYADEHQWKVNLKMEGVDIQKQPPEVFYKKLLLKISQ